MGVSTAPPPSRSMKTLKKRRLEVLSAYCYVRTFLFTAGPFCSLLFLLFTSLWYFSVLYLVWFFLDRDTHPPGGRRSEWMRNCTVWKHLRDYFPIKLVKTVELPPDRNYLLVAHPHGIMTMGILCNFSTESSSFSQQFPRLRPLTAMLNGLFHFPVYRGYLLSFGGCSVNRQSLAFILSQPHVGQAVVILVRAHESLYAIPGEHCLTVQNRKGFVHLALRHVTSLVPVYSFGENDIFRVKAFAPDLWQHLCKMLGFKKLLGFSPCIFWGCGLFSADSWGLGPFSRPMTTVVGCPIPVPQCLGPTEEQVDHSHVLYVKALEQLFDEHKESCSVPASTRPTFI
uniref:Acyltransferase n=1 Tax=Neophocaena phocaenoides TaxID=34892 RepID=A0A0N9DRB5_NEOPH|nr:monoacylglycerol O-acyltransferase 3 [Neophocaena phocaenoides]